MRGAIVRQIALPVTFGGRPAGVIQHGTVDSRPIHGAACRCGAAVYDVATFHDVARWLREHLDGAHGIVLVEVDLRRLVLRQSESWERRAGEVVAQLALCWGDTGANRLVVRAA
jgi:hypothetical protein